MAVMPLVGAQGPLAASRLSCTEPLMRITRCLLASSSAGLQILLTVILLEIGKYNPKLWMHISAVSLNLLDMDKLYYLKI